MKNEDLVKAIKLHGLWLAGNAEGRCADLEGADLSAADLRGANLEGADLRNVDLSAVNLKGAVLSFANLKGANLRGADLRYAILRGADLRYADLSAADLSAADLRYADLRDATLSVADLRCADLSAANLRGANLEGAVLRGANLKDANLRDTALPIPSGARDPRSLRRAVAWHIENHPELHNQSSWGDGSDNPSCGTPCCVAGWACHLGGGDRGLGVATAAVLLLHADGLPMPSFEANASREDILAALKAE